MPSFGLYQSAERKESLIAQVELEHMEAKEPSNQNILPINSPVSSNLVEQIWLPQAPDLSIDTISRYAKKFAVKELSNKSNKPSRNQTPSKSQTLECQKSNNRIMTNYSKTRNKKTPQSKMRTPCAQAAIAAKSPKRSEINLNLKVCIENQKDKQLEVSKEISESRPKSREPSGSISPTQVVAKINLVSNV